VILGALALSASGASAAKVKGPLGGLHSITPGKKVKFKAKGFEPGVELSVQVAPREHRGGNCCGVAIKKTFTTDDAGAKAGHAILGFRFPKRWSRCAGVENCSKHPWEKGSKADVNVCTTDASECARKVVRIKG
jgi:hypothetical protein